MSSSKLKYEPGTRYSDSVIYDEATTELIHGWQVFIQKRPDGSSTGSKSFVDHRGNLCGIELAESRRAVALRDAAMDLAKTLQIALRHAREAMPATERAAFDEKKHGPEWMFTARDLLDRLPL